MTLEFILKHVSHSVFKCCTNISNPPFISAIDAFNPTEAQQRLLDQIIMLEVEQGPGEMLIIPTGWWHQVSVCLNVWVVGGSYFGWSFSYT